MNLCEPKCYLSICDNSVRIAQSNVSATLIVHKGNIRQCDIELNSIAGDIILTSSEILEFGAEGTVFKIQLRDANNTPINLMYFDCNGVAKLAKMIRLVFFECENQNPFLYEIC